MVVHITAVTALLLMVAPALALSAPAPSSAVRKIVVTGAGGQTGQALFRKMLALPDEFAPVGIVRTESSKSELVKSGGIPAASIVVVDVASNADALKEVAKGCDGFAICTSAKPAPTGETTEEGRPLFGFPNGSPEVVDWEGQKNQIDACGPDTHVVLCSSMGGTDPNHPLNALGKVDGKGGNILKWKRKAEKYLIDSGRLYTVVHPGGLLNEPGDERELVVGVDDSTEGTDSRTVPRNDVASVMLNAFRYPKAYANRSFDLRAKPPGDGAPTIDFEALIESLGGGKNCDYSLGEIAL